MKKLLFILLLASMPFFSTAQPDSTTVYSKVVYGLRVLDDAGIDGAIEDKDGDKGTSGQVLSSTGSQINWIDQLVTSVFGRAGVVTAQSGDYDATQITNFDVEVGNNTDVAANTAARNPTIDNVLTNGNTSAQNMTIGDIAVNGGDITTTATTASLYTSNATDINIGSGSSTVNIGNDLDVTSGKITTSELELTNSNFVPLILDRPIVSGSQAIRFTNNIAGWDVLGDETQFLIRSLDIPVAVKSIPFSIDYSTDKLTLSADLEVNSTITSSGGTTTIGNDLDVSGDLEVSGTDPSSIAGNLGIDELAADEKLEVNGNVHVTGNIRVDNDIDNYWEIVNTGEGVTDIKTGATAATNLAMTFNDNANISVYEDFGVKTTPDELLHIKDEDPILKIEDNSAADNFAAIELTTTEQSWFIKNGNLNDATSKDFVISLTQTTSFPYFTIEGTSGNIGNVIIQESVSADTVFYNELVALSDTTMKEEIELLGEVGDKTKCIKPIKFKYKNQDGEGKHHGFNAQEVKSQFPEAVIKKPVKTGELKDHVVTSTIIALLWKDLQEEKERTYSLEQRIDILEVDYWMQVEENKALSDRITAIELLLAQ